MHPERIEKQVEFLDKNQDIDMVYGNMIIFWEDKNEKILYEAPEFENPLERLKEIKNSEESIKELGKKYHGVAQILDKKDYIPGISVTLRRNIIDSGKTTHQINSSIKFLKMLLSFRKIIFFNKKN
jgi:hypothetical protein